MKTLIVANWKMNPLTLFGARKLLNSVKRELLKNRILKGVEVVICPPFTYLAHFFLLLKRSQLKLGAQDCFWEQTGAFTGEISPRMLKDVGCVYVILGHSERRQHFNETEDIINKKIKAALMTGLKPILCIGENSDEREKGNVFDVLKYQLQYGLKGIPEKDMKNIIIAYEPVWAIGTGNFCEIDKANEILVFLRKILKTNYFLYGGSVNSQNAKDYIKNAGFEGLLVGNASLKPEEFLNIIKSIDQTL